MIDALMKRVSVSFKCYEMYAHRGKKVQLLVLSFPETSSSFEKQATGPGLLKDSPYSIS